MGTKGRISTTSSTWRPVANVLQLLGHVTSGIDSRDHVAPRNAFGNCTGVSGPFLIGQIPYLARERYRRATENRAIVFDQYLPVNGKCRRRRSQCTRRRIFGRFDRTASNINVVIR